MELFVFTGENMSEAFKCDRCEKIIQGDSSISLTSFLTPDIDLCENCHKDFKEFMEEKFND